MHISPITNAQHVDSYIVGPLLAVLYTDPNTDSADTYHHFLYIYRPDPQSPPSPGNPPPRVMTVIALTDADSNDVMRVITEAGAKDGPVNPKLLSLDGFIEYGLALVSRRYNIRREPIRLPMPNADAPFGA